MLRVEIKDIVKRGLSLEYALNNLSNEYTKGTVRKYYNTFKEKGVGVE